MKITSISVLPVVVTVLAIGAPKIALAQDDSEEVLYQAFQSGALAATIKIGERNLLMPMGWDSVPTQSDPALRWTMARWDGGSDKRRVERTYLVTNGNGLPGCWLTKILAHRVGPGFALSCIVLNDKDAARADLTIRVTDDAGLGCDATIGFGGKPESNRIRNIISPPTVVRVDGARTVKTAKTQVLAVGETSVPEMRRLQWYRARLVFQQEELILSVDDRVLVRTSDVSPRNLTAVQFMSPHRIFLDDFEMRGVVQRESIQPRQDSEPVGRER